MVEALRVTNGKRTELMLVQIVFEGLALIETLAITFALTVIVIAEDVAGLPFTQVAFDVITQVIASLLFNEASE